MTEQEQDLLRQLDGAYGRKRFGEMGKLQEKLVKEIVKARLPSQDVLMVLTVMARQIEASFIGKMHPKQEPKQVIKPEEK